MTPPFFMPTSGTLSVDQAYPTICNGSPIKCCVERSVPESPALSEGGDLMLLRQIHFVSKPGRPLPVID